MNRREMKGKGEGGRRKEEGKDWKEKVRGGSHALLP
jgi:hypothetical protein